MSEREVRIANKYFEDEEVMEQEDVGVKVFFENLDEETQKKLMESLMEAVNASEDDKYSNEKIVEALAKVPLVVLRGEEIARQIDIDL